MKLWSPKHSKPFDCGLINTSELPLLTSQYPLFCRHNSNQQTENCTNFKVRHRSEKISDPSIHQYKIFYQSPQLCTLYQDTGSQGLSVLKHAQTYRHNISMHKISKDENTAPIFHYIIRQQQSM